MLQEDSNGEASFEIVDKKLGETNTNSDKTESLSSVSSAYSIPSPSIVNIPGGNLLSNVTPPSQLPDFVLYASKTPSVGVSPTVQIPPPTSTTQPTVIPNVQNFDQQFPATQFSAAIPPSKGVPHGPIPVASAVNENESSSGGIMGLVKEAFSSGGVLSKMAEKAKNSVDSIITTLDPQMSEYIYSGGDTEVTVTSENEEEVSAVREAFHSVFGKAWVNGIKLNFPSSSLQSVGFDEAVKNCEEKIEYSLKYRKTPTLGIESLLLEENNEWYDLSVLVLKDVDNDLCLKTFTQATPVPVEKILKQIENERPDYKLYDRKDKLAAYLRTTPGWRHCVSGVTDKEVLLLAAKTLVRIYKNKISEKRV